MSDAPPPALGTSEELIKVAAHWTHLLTSFVELRGRYALLHPMLFTERVAEQYGSLDQRRGFGILRDTLFLFCCQDIAKMLWDDHKTTPSILRLMQKLHRVEVRSALRQQNIINRSEVNREEQEATFAALHEEKAAQEGAAGVAQFDKSYEEINLLWQDLSSTKLLSDFKIIRDRITAHTHLQVTNGRYEAVTLASTEIKSSDLKATIDKIQHLLTLIGHLVKDADFTWDYVDRSLTAAGDRFWRDRG